MSLSDVLSLLQENQIVVRVEGEHLRMFPPSDLAQEQVSFAVSLVRERKAELLAYLTEPTSGGQVQPIDADPFEVEQITEPAPTVDTAIPQKVVCRAHWHLNKEGKPCKAYKESTHSTAECGNDTWIWSPLDNGPICSKCYTPRTNQLESRVPAIIEHQPVDYWEEIERNLTAKGYYKAFARDSERLLSLAVPPRSYPAPFPAYGRRPDGTFGQVGTHGSQPGEYWTMDEWEALQKGQVPA